MKAKSKRYNDIKMKNLQNYFFMFYGYATYYIHLTLLMYEKSAWYNCYLCLFDVLAYYFSNIIFDRKIKLKKI